MVMSKIVKKKWLNALRSGKYKQTTGRLSDGDGYCCLGVLCAITGNKNNRDTNQGFPKEDGESNPKEFMGLTSDQQSHLANMNDQDHSDFFEIASYISKNIKAV